MVEEKTKSRFVLTEVPATYGVAIKDTEKDITYSEQEILIEILNKLDRIEKGVA